MVNCNLYAQSTWTHANCCRGVGLLLRSYIAAYYLQRTPVENLSVSCSIHVYVATNILIIQKCLAMSTIHCWCVVHILESMYSD